LPENSDAFFALILMRKNGIAANEIPSSNFWNINKTNRLTYAAGKGFPKVAFKGKTQYKQTNRFGEFST